MCQPRTKKHSVWCFCLKILKHIIRFCMVSLITPGHRRIPEDTQRHLYLLIKFPFIEQQKCLTILKKYKKNKIWKFHSANNSYTNHYTLYLLSISSPSSNRYPRTHLLLPSWKHAYSNILKILQPKKKRKFSDKKFWYFSYFCTKHRLWVLVRTASMRQF